MKKIFIGTIAMLGFGLSSAQAQFVVIDNYNSGTFNVTANAGMPSDFAFNSGLPTTSTIGGQRIARSHFVSGGGSGDEINVNNTAQPGQLQVNLTSSATGHFHNYYGYNTYDTGTSDPTSNTHGFNDLNSDVQAVLGPLVGVELNFLTMDHNATFIFKLVTNRGGGAGQTVSVVSVFQPATLSPFQIVITPGQLNAGITSGTSLNFGDVDQIVLESADLEGGTDFRLNEVRFFSVPEPTTYALVGAGIAVVGAASWVVRRRRMNLENQEVQTAELS